MTPQEQKELAEFAQGFLGKPIIHASSLFHNDKEAPILAHLAKREMEKLGFDCDYIQQVGVHTYEFDLSLDYDRPVARGEHDNEYIALWLAIREAVKDE